LEHAAEGTAAQGANVTVEVVKVVLECTARDARTDDA